MIARLNRIKGQIEGLVKLIENDKNCEELFVQFKAVKSALNSTFAKFLELNLKNCLQKKETEKLHKLIKMLIECEK